MKDRTFALFVALNMLWASAALAAIKKGPYLQNVTQGSVTVVWETDSASGGKVNWGETPQYGNVATQSGSNAMHAVELTSLNPGTTYYYMAEGDSKGGSFVTAPLPSQPFSFVVYGDNRSNQGDHQSVVDAIITEAPPLLLNSGDLVDTGSDSGQWQTFFDVEKELLRGACLFPAVGNHELLYDPTIQQYLKWFYLPQSPAGGEKYYSFDYGNTHFAVLNTNDLALTTTQKDWLKQDLIAASGDPDIEHIFTMMHHGPYSAGNHGDNYSAKTAIVPVLKQFGVDMTFAGHDHSYERGEVDGLRYIVSGGGGAPLYGVDKGPGTITSEKTLHYVVFNVNGGRVEGCAKRPDGSTIECFGWGQAAADAGTPDTGLDAGGQDSGTTDTGLPDAGTPDAASQTDTGPSDVPAETDASAEDSGGQTGDDVPAADDTGGGTDAAKTDAGEPEDGDSTDGHAGKKSDTGPILRPDDASEGDAGEPGGCSCTVIDFGVR
ncbi:MAG: metallophosphoesterase [Deltaproteobacteria bacterium]|nr:metallophosphoesterase [Deltaproteobacteria bacterium]